VNAPSYKTRAQQRLEWLESLQRPLTEEESDLLRRSLHAVYNLNRRRRIEAEMAAKVLRQHREEELRTLAAVLEESKR
jgi:hypothetical protein